MDLPLIWAMLIAVAVILYVILDGMDLGVGMLSALASDDEERNMMTATIEPVWDGNETWLILGGGGMLAAFPLAYAIIMPAVYLPVLIMLAALIFRGVAFEFRHKAVRAPTKRFWNGAFYGGSLVAAVSQGFILGAFIQGFETEGRAFAGGAFDWLSPFSLLTGVSVAIGYILLGACWLILKTEGALQAKAKRYALIALIAVSVCFALVSIATLSVDPRVTERWGVSMTEIDFAKFIRGRADADRRFHSNRVIAPRPKRCRHSKGRPGLAALFIGRRYFSDRLYWFRHQPLPLAGSLRVDHLGHGCAR